MYKWLLASAIIANQANQLEDLERICQERKELCSNLNRLPFYNQIEFVTKNTTSWDTLNKKTTDICNNLEKQKLNSEDKNKLIVLKDAITQQNTMWMSAKIANQ